MKKIGIGSVLSLLICNEVLSLLIVIIWGWIGIIALFKAMAANNFY